jgi:hypothetical protein
MALAAALQRSSTARRLWHAVPDRVRDEVWKLAVPRRPLSFNEKVRYKMIKDRRPLLTTFADKVAVRDYVAQKAGTDLLTQLYLVTDDPEQIRSDCLPREFVIKPSHGSGACVVVADHAPAENTLPQPPAGWGRSLVTPDSLDWTVLGSLCREWLGLSWNRHQEWAYANVPPRILAEELLIAKGSVPPDYKFFVFHGRVRLVQVDCGRFGNHVRTFYSPEWDHLPVAYYYPTGPGIDRPGSLREMISIAERLGQETDFVRVDLYAIGDRIVFGELTNYPEAGHRSFEPASFDYQLGSWWSLPNRSGKGSRRIRKLNAPDAKLSGGNQAGGRD